MTYRNATISAYDSLTEVVVVAVVRTKDEYGMGDAHRTTTASVQFRGSGEENDARWLRDALVALAETL